MNYLCVESTSKKSFLALFSDSKQMDVFFLDPKIKLSESLPALVRPLFSFLKNQNLKLDFIAVNQGPGRFTGLRAGVNFAKTLAYYFKIPLYPCSSLRLMAEPYLKDNTVVSIMEAFGQMLYMAAYVRGEGEVKTRISPKAVHKEELQKHLPTDNFFLCAMEPLKMLSSPILAHDKTEEAEISPESFSKVVLEKKENLETVSEAHFLHWEQLEPLYLRGPGIIQ